MNLDELQSVQSRERQIDSLQQLRDSFYEDAGRFVRQLREEREHVAANADDPFDSTDVRRLSDEINTAEQTVEAIYERRIGKLVKQASLEAAGMAADVEGLTNEERVAFDRLVSTIEENRTHVLNEVLANDQNTSTDPTPTSPSTSTETNEPNRDNSTERSVSVEPKSEPESKSKSNSKSNSDSGTDPESVPISEPTSTSESEPDLESVQSTGTDSSTVSAADVMGDGGETVAQDSNQVIPPDVAPDEGTEVPVHERVSDAPEREDGNENEGGDGFDSGFDTETGTETDSGVDTTADSAKDRTQIDRIMVRITRDVGEILCVDGRAYDLSKSDVVTLPETNVGPLLEHDAAVRLD